MGTTAQKLQRVLDTKEGLKDTINTYLGQDITSAIPFKDYETYIKNFYGSLPKTSYAEGSNITLSNTLKGKLDFEDDIVGIGDTSQKSYQGYQMLKNTSTNSGDNNYWYHFGTFDETTGTLTQTTNEAREALIGHRLGGLEKNTTYTLSLYAKSNGYVMSMDLFCYNQQVQGVVSRTGIPLTTEFQKITWTFTTTNDVEYGSGTIVRADNNGTTQVGTDAILTIKDVMLEKGSTAHDWEPYVGEEKSQSPSYPQEIEVVRGKNEAYVNTSTSPNVSDFAKIEQGKTYTFSMKVNGSMSGVNLRYGENVIKTFYGASGNISHTFVAPITGTLNLNGYGVDNFNGYEEIQLEKGSQATSYLPYNTIEVVERGINLNEYNINSATNKFQSIINLKNSITFKANNTYTLAFDTPNTGIVVYHQALDGITWDKYSVTLNGTRRYFTFTIGDNDITTVSNWGIILRITDTSEISTGLVTNVMLYKGEYNSSIPYEPYQTPQTYQLSLGEYEFAKIGNYVDTIEYDVDEDKVYKNKAINKYQFTGNENFGKAASTNLNGYIFNFPSVTANILAPANNGIKANILSNAFITKAVDTIISEATYGIGIRSDKYLYIGAPLGSFESVSALQTYLANNITFMYYALATAVKEEITGTLKDQIKALYNSQSFTGTTIIEIDGQLPLIIKVRALKGE